MFSRKNKFIAFLCFTLIFSASLFAQSSTVAVATKSVGGTERKSLGADYKKDIKRGTQLLNKDWVKTSDDGYLAIMFIDDKTLLKLRENSEIEISTDRTSDRLNKSIQMKFGKLKAEISPQRTGEFTIATPTSVASVKGTIFWIISTPTGDQFVGIEGSFTVTNNESGQTVEVGVGQTATSNTDGTVDVQTTAAGGVPDDPGATDDVNQLRIRLENEDGETKEIIIEY